MQHVTVKSTHFHAWTSHLFGTVIGGALTGCILGLLVGLALGGTEQDDLQVIGFFGLAGVGVYLVLFMVYTFVRAALGKYHE